MQPWGRAEEGVGKYAGVVGLFEALLMNVANAGSAACVNCMRLG